MRLFAFHSQLSGPEAWLPLWEAIRGEITDRGGALAAAIVIKPWFETLLRNSGFERHQSIVLLEWTARLMEPYPLPHGVSIRPMLPADLDAVVETDASAFDPLWCNSLHTLQKAYSLAVAATVAEEAGVVLGYQISTGNMLGAHLARLGVRREAQGRGIGAALVSDLILRLSPRNPARITVNTQAENGASLALYQKLGFVRTGEQYPVYVYQV
jgi:ribosomal-protein-alanine N-acetyltransferase